MNNAANETRTKAWLLGATGLVGQSLLRQLAASQQHEQVLAWVRKSGSVSSAAGISSHVVNFEHTGQWPTGPVDTVYCCLGTTQKKAGSKAAFKKIDHDLVLALAHYAKAQGCRHFLVITALGADPASSSFYSRVKGEVEQALTAIGFEQLSIFRPSLLAGDRTEHRLGEQIGLQLAQAFKVLIPLKYQAVHVDAVASAMREAARQVIRGGKIYESDAIQTHYQNARHQ
ncbi:MAG: oxidoreductase [Burkholderiales bacterium]|nr:oxidoreductase [Burkholderiales bacterium]